MPHESFSEQPEPEAPHTPDALTDANLANDVASAPEDTAATPEQTQPSPEPPKEKGAWEKHSDGTGPYPWHLT